MSELTAGERKPEAPESVTSFAQTVLRIPATISETGLNSDFLVQLIMKALYFAGEVNGAYLAERLKLPYSVIDELMNFLRGQAFCEVKGVDGSGRLFYRYGITSLGRERTREFLEINQYTGPAPITLTQYISVMQKQSILKAPVSRSDVMQGFSHLVLSQEALDLLGQAISSGRAMFLYGPSGNGKTIISEAIGKIISHASGNQIFIPYAVEIDGHIVKVFDQVNHTAVLENSSPTLLEQEGRFDGRWVLCKRPVVFVGGELSLNMLDLSLNPISKYYEAPLQMKANGGVFIIDDFGRQLVSPWDLLNRWIVPLEKRMDYLTLHTGKKFPVPFDSLVVFATNLEPQSLVDEAFFRRIRFKMPVEDPTLDTFSEIFRRYCEANGIEYRPQSIEYLHQEYYQKFRIKMRSCHPRDLIDQIISAAKYLDRPPALSTELLDKACRTYFILK
ncbi:MAG: ATP-binding protein [Acidobacteria bacterium]|nr:ATP-binding protein [Acidobacteriota bacterium]MBI3657973.1 ATP-binding protein [Acidobacteriota bacterium]